jgi:hypothetical protein
VSDLTRCPHSDCKSVVYIDDRYCNGCNRDMHDAIETVSAVLRLPMPRNKPNSPVSNE